MGSIDKDKSNNVFEEKEVGSIDKVVRQFNDFDEQHNFEKYGTVKRKLNSRHVSLMIIGQSIGTGLFIGLSGPLKTSGSLSLFTGFIAWACLVIWPLMQCVAEMCSYLPIKGTFLHYAARWVDPALGFAATLIYLYTSLMFVCVEIVAFASVISFWTDVNPGVFIAVCIVSIFLFNIFGVNWYGEIEFVSSILKVILVVGLMFFGLITMCGANPKNDAYGFRNWSQGGLVKPYLVEGSTGKFLGWWNVLIYAAFSCGGPDLLAMVAGEVSQPRKAIPLAGRRAYIRIYLFYFGGIFFMNSLCASNDPALVAAGASGATGAAASPWVIGVKNVGVHGLDSLVNAVIMTSAWSCGNGFMYGATRTLYSAALAGYAPRFFAKCLKNGAPIYSVSFSMAIALLSFLSIKSSTATVFNWFINLSTTGILSTYLCIWWCYFKYRKALSAQGISYQNDTPFQAPRFVHPYMTYLGCFINILVLFFNGFWIFFPGQFSVANLFTSYFAPVFFVACFIFWKFFKKTHFRSDMEADIISGKEEIDQEESMEKEYLDSLPKRDGLFFKVWYKFCDICFN